MEVCKDEPFDRSLAHVLHSERIFPGWIASAPSAPPLTVMPSAAPGASEPDEADVELPETEPVTDTDGTRHDSADDVHLIDTSQATRLIPTSTPRVQKTMRRPPKGASKVSSSSDRV